MEYKETLQIITEELNKMQIKIMLKPEYLFKTQKFKKRRLCLELANNINKRLDSPWMSKEELEGITNRDVLICKTSKNNKYYSTTYMEIYSTIIHNEYYLDEDYNMYINLTLQHSGQEHKDYNPFIVVKLRLFQSLVMLKLTNYEYKLDLKNYLQSPMKYSIITDRVLLESNDIAKEAELI